MVVSEAPEGDLKKLGVQRATRVVSLETRVVSLADSLVRFVILLGVVWSFLENLYKLIFGCFRKISDLLLVLSFENSCFGEGRKPKTVVVIVQLVLILI